MLTRLAFAFLPFKRVPGLLHALRGARDTVHTGEVLIYVSNTPYCLLVLRPNALAPVVHILGRHARCNDSALPPTRRTRSTESTPTRVSWGSSSSTPMGSQSKLPSRCVYLTNHKPSIFSSPPQKCRVSLVGEENRGAINS